MTDGNFIIASSNHSVSNDFREIISLAKKLSIFYALRFFLNINRKIWLLKIVSRDSLFPLTSKDFPIAIDDTNYVNTKQIKTYLKLT